MPALSFPNELRQLTPDLVNRVTGIDDGKLLVQVRLIVLISLHVLGPTRRPNAC